MKKRKLILVAVVAALVVLLTSCRLDPRGLSIELISYTSNGLTYESSINTYSLFERFSYDDVTFSIDEEGNLTLIILGQTKHGKLGTIDDDSDDKSQTNWTFTMDDGTEGTGYSAWYGTDTKKCVIHYLGETYIFCEGPMEQKDEIEDAESAIKTRIASIKNYLEFRVPGEYDRNYTYGNIILKGSHYYFVDEISETETRLILDCGYFYQYGDETLAVSETIRSGACLLRGMIAADTPYMIFYID